MKLCDYLKKLSPWRKEQALLAAIERLIESEEVSYTETPEEDEEPLTWSACGEPLWEET